MYNEIKSKLTNKQKIIWNVENIASQLKIELMK